MHKQLRQISLSMFSLTRKKWPSLSLLVKNSTTHCFPLLHPGNAKAATVCLNLSLSLLLQCSYPTPTPQRNGWRSQVKVNFKLAVFSPLQEWPEWFTFFGTAIFSPPCCGVQSFHQLQPTIPALFAQWFLSQEFLFLLYIGQTLLNRNNSDCAVLAPRDFEQPPLFCQVWSHLSSSWVKGISRHFVGERILWLNVTWLLPTVGLAVAESSSGWSWRFSRSGETALMEGRRVNGQLMTEAAWVYARSWGTCRAFVNACIPFKLKTSHFGMIANFQSSG